MKRTKGWMLQLEREALAAAADLEREWDEDATDRVMAIREAYIHEDYTALADWRDSLQLRLAERRAGV